MFELQSVLDCLTPVESFPNFSFASAKPQNGCGCACPERERRSVSPPVKRVAYGAAEHLLSLFFYRMRYKMFWQEGKLSLLVRLAVGSRSALPELGIPLPSHTPKYCLVRTMMLCVLFCRLLAFFPPGVW